MLVRHVRAGGHGCALLRNALLSTIGVPERFHVPVSVAVGGENPAPRRSNRQFAIEPVEQIGRVERDEIQLGALLLVGKRVLDRPFDTSVAAIRALKRKSMEPAIERLSAGRRLSHAGRYRRVSGDHRDSPEIAGIVLARAPGDGKFRTALSGRPVDRSGVEGPQPWSLYLDAVDENRPEARSRLPCVSRKSGLPGPGSFQAAWIPVRLSHAARSSPAMLLKFCETASPYRSAESPLPCRRDLRAGTVEHEFECPEALDGDALPLEGLPGLWRSRLSCENCLACFKPVLFRSG